MKGLIPYCIQNKSGNFTVLMVHVLPSLETAPTRPWQRICLNHQVIKLHKSSNIVLSSVFSYHPTLMRSAYTAVLTIWSEQYCYSLFPILIIPYTSQSSFLFLFILCSKACSNQGFSFFSSFPQLCLIIMLLFSLKSRERVLFISMKI